MVSTSKPFYHVSIGIIFDQGRLFINQRTSDRVLGGFWEFPGGKIELNETPEEALIRELREEIGIEVIECQHLFQYPYEYPMRQVMLEVFWVKRFIGEPHPHEQQAIEWITQVDIPQYQFLDANLGMMDQIRTLWNACS
jgi:8-oxo-dGTP diphosphatase